MVVAARNHRVKNPFAILHIPHASKVIPLDVRESLIISDDEIAEELIRMTDSFTDELFDCEPELAIKIIFPVSRLVVDPERFVEDSDEPMASKGMGVVYTKTSRNHRLRRDLSHEERAHLIAKYYEPHYTRLTEAVGDTLRLHGSCLIIDCHSFPSKALPHEPDQSPNRPDICIGRDEFHTTTWLASLALTSFEENGFLAKLDSPFCGSMVPKGYHNISAEVLSIMIEVNRSLYMNEAFGIRDQKFKPFRGALQAILRSLIIKTQAKALS